MHVPVLLQEVIEGLSIKKGDTVLDCTFGDGGHAKEICSRIGKEGRLIGIDQDENALKKAKESFKNEICNLVLVEENFRNLDIVLKKLKTKYVHAVLFDLGLRTDQLKESGRGFSFRKNEPLLMTFHAKLKPGDLTAYEIVNSWKAEEIEKILREFGEERFARGIAHGIVNTRKKIQIQTTDDLIQIIEKSTPLFYRRGRGHAARKTFQALRIAVNDELGALKEGLLKSAPVVTKGGRIAVISFHSLEDRIVKNFFKKIKEEKNFKIITKKPIIPKEEEIESNPFSRSAKLRIVEKIL